MYISKVEIKNFRIFDETGITAFFNKGVNAIISENNCGKTAIIDAIRIALSTVPYKKDIYFNLSDFHVRNNGERCNEAFISVYFNEISPDFFEIWDPEDISKGEFHVRYYTVKTPEGKEKVRYNVWGGPVEGNSVSADIFEAIQLVFLGALRDAETEMRPSRSSKLASLFGTATNTDAAKEEITEVLRKANREECVNLPVLIALCYASLMSAFPGKTFYTLLCRMKSDNYEPQNMEEVFIYAEQEMCEVSEQQIKNLFERIDWAFPTEIDEVTGRDFVEPLMSDLIKTNRWLKDRYQYVSQNEYDFRKALIYVLEEVEESKRITAMRILLDEYSHPIVIDRKGMLYGEKKELVSVLGPYAIQEIVINRQKTCAILGTCKALKKSYTVECSQCCWREKKTVCILRFYLYVMGLGNVDFAELEGSPFEI